MPYGRLVWQRQRQLVSGHAHMPEAWTAQLDMQASGTAPHTCSLPASTPSALCTCMLTTPLRDRSLDTASIPAFKGQALKHLQTAATAHVYTTRQSALCQSATALQAMRQAGLMGPVPASQLLPLHCSSMADVLDSILHVRPCPIPVKSALLGPALKCCAASVLDYVTKQHRGRR